MLTYFATQIVKYMYISGFFYINVFINIILTDIEDTDEEKELKHQ